MHFYGVVVVLLSGIDLGIHGGSQRCAYGMSHILKGGAFALCCRGIGLWFLKSRFTVASDCDRVHQYTPSAALDNILLASRS